MFAAPECALHVPFVLGKIGRVAWVEAVAPCYAVTERAHGAAIWPQREA